MLYSTTRDTSSAKVTWLPGLSHCLTLARAAMARLDGDRNTFFFAALEYTDGMLCTSRQRSKPSSAPPSSWL
ncbi:hypothetical protein D3C73_1583500 [compost metagenome]